MGYHTARAATVLQELLPMVNPSEDHRTLYVSEGAESGFCIEADRDKISIRYHDLRGSGTRLAGGGQLPR